MCRIFAAIAIIFLLLTPTLADETQRAALRHLRGTIPRVEIENPDIATIISQDEFIEDWKAVNPRR